MGVELEDAEVGESGRDDLHDRHRRRVVAAEHEGNEPRPPPRRDLGAGRVELLAGRRAVGQLAVADVRERQILQVPPERGRVCLDRVGGEPKVSRAAAGTFPEVDAALERDAVDDDAGVLEVARTSDEAWRGA